MKLAIAYSSKDQNELSRQTIQPLLQHRIDLLWCDASTGDGASFFDLQRNQAVISDFVLGGADAAIAWKLTRMLENPEYTHVGLLENDVLLDEDWFEPTMELFEKGKADGLTVGAASSRSYVDRVLIQREGYAVMHNLGAGMVVFTREAAEIVLRSFRTHWWPANRLLFAQLSGIDLAAYAAFRGSQHFVSTDWGFDAQLASHGLASLALTPAKCQMIGQKWPLEQQGLELTGNDLGRLELMQDKKGFELYRANLQKIREGVYKSELPGIIHRDGAGMMFFAHQLGYLGGALWQGALELKWNQGFGPFNYRAGPGGASLSVPISGSLCFLVNGGATGAKVALTDTRSGFNFAPDFPPAPDGFGGISPIAVSVPGGPIPRTIKCELSEGAVFFGLSTTDPQLLYDAFRFDWQQLPKAV